MNMQQNVRRRRRACHWCSALAAAAAAQPPAGRGGRGAGRGQGPPPAGPAQPRDGRGGGQPLAAGTAAVSGTVVVAGTGQPARRARITLNATEGGGSRTAMTDEEGRYAFIGVGAGRYMLSASKTGHVGVIFGQTRPGRPGTPIQLTDGQKFAANLQLPRGSVITGTVVDEYGEPTPGTQVRVMRYVVQAGRRTLQQTGSGATDDRGIYRVYGLQPGEYIVSAVPRNAGPAVDVGAAAGGARAGPRADRRRARRRGRRARARRRGPRCCRARCRGRRSRAPATRPCIFRARSAPAQAGAVMLNLGEERTGVDFQLQRVAMARIDGIVVNSTGQATDNVQITLTDPAAPTAGAVSMAARADAEGRFHLSNVPPGSYRLIARAAVAQSGAPAAGQGPVRRARHAAARPAVDGDSALGQRRRAGRRTQPDQRGGHAAAGAHRLRPHRVPGHDRAAPGRPDAHARQPGAGRSRAAAPGLMMNAAGTVDASGKFTIASVVPGLYRFGAGGAGNGWYLESAIIDGQDTLDVPFEVKPGSAPSSAVITFTDRQSQLTGTITNQRGQPAPEQTLILYPADERFWVPQSRRIRSTRPSTDGVFTFTGIPPGDYKLVAMVDVETGAWFDPAFLQQIDAASTRITVNEGEKKVQNLQISSGG